MDARHLCQSGVRYRLKPQVLLSTKRFGCTGSDAPRSYFSVAAPRSAIVQLDDITRRPVKSVPLSNPSQVFGCQHLPTLAMIGSKLLDGRKTQVRCVSDQL